MFRTLERDLGVLQSFAILRGRVSVEPKPEAPIVVVLYTGAAGQERIVDDYVQGRPGEYFFVVPPGEYRIAAFEDRRGDLSYRRAVDPAARFNEGETVSAVAGRQTGGLDIFLRADTSERLEFDFVVSPDSDHGRDDLPTQHVGEIVTLDDTRFSNENAAMGLWRPAEFLFDIGPGIYFLEPYDEGKTPVLFIHGALGHPGVWREVLAELDRSRFQPWFAYYPTAASLDNVATAIERWLQLLEAQYGFDRLFIVAHSMGGLVARDLAGRMAARGWPDSGDVGLLVTMATPWGGQSGAQLGVQQAPVVAPSWYDMAPGSPFLESLWTKPLPEQVPYHLLFTYGGGSALMQGANDGAVTLASALEPRAQKAADPVYGFDVGHGYILRSHRPAEELHHSLVETDDE